MNVRSRGLAAVGLLLLFSAAALGFIVAHDSADVQAADLAQAEPGQRVEVKGTPEPFYPTGSLRAWRDILPHLGNHTYALPSDGDGVVAVLTGEQRAPDGVALAEGTVAWIGPHPDGSDRLLVVVLVTAWHEPILLR